MKALHSATMDGSPRLARSVVAVALGAVLASAASGAAAQGGSGVDLGAVRVPDAPIERTWNFSMSSPPGRTPIDVSQGSIAAQPATLRFRALALGRADAYEQSASDRATLRAALVPTAPVDAALLGDVLRFEAAHDHLVASARR